MEPKIVKTKEELELCYMRLSERFMSIAKKYEEAKANADALRKENEELCKLLGECPKRNRLSSYTQMQPMQIDVCKLLCNANESEASHE